MGLSSKCNGAVSDNMLQISMGTKPGYSSVNKFGANSNVIKNTRKDVWDGLVDYTFPATADITHISQKADQAAMRGATIEVQGLDTNWDLVVQTKTLDATLSTTAVALDTPLRRIFRMKVLANVIGDQDIEAHNAGKTFTYAIMSAGNNQTLMAIYTVPRGKTAYMTQYFASVVESTGKEPKSTNIGVWTSDRENTYEFQLKHEQGIPKAGSGVEHKFTPYMRINEKTDVKITAACDNENGHIHAGFDLILVDN